MSMPTALAVVIPARDEEELLPACLDSVTGAVEALASAFPEIACRVFVVLDCCQDDSSRAVALRPDVTGVAVQAGCVGAARACGVEAAARWASSPVSGGLWVANTDADSTVPTSWLVQQVGFAAAGHDLVVGTVQPVAGDLTAYELAQWQARHSLIDGHDHVHGANLGFSLAAYRSVGGFRAIPVHEDVELVVALRRAGVAWVAPGNLSVITSGRRIARAPDGFADYLDGLGA
ncbi:glycosyltransferase [Nocardioides sp.]|uniref:glycosyltransferase n=1 Tax=Nocardioides sp. TaxID=35761 RepID=UPI00286D9E6C|nr:glycosyltransferase [Nocardioides sp.]